MSSIQSDVGRQGKVVVAGVILGCAAIGYVAITWWTDSNRKESRVGIVQTAARGTPSQETEHYAQVLDRYNRQNANAAERQGASYLSVMSSRENAVADKPPTAPQVEPQPQYQQPVQQVVYNPPPQQQPQRNAQHDQQRAKEVAEQMQGLMANWAPAPHGAARVSADGADYAKSLALPAESVQAPAAASQTKVVEDFALVPASLDTDIDTDENSVVRAKIESGRYDGAMLYAMGYKRLTNTVDMTFTFMRWQGHTYKITAKAVDQTTMRTSLSGEVNNRYFSRIILPAIASGIGRAGQLYEQANAQNIITPQGGIIQTYPSTPSASAVTGTILGGVANQAGQVLANDAANMPVKQVLIPRRTTIGIQFIGPVLASDDIAAGATGPGRPAQPGEDPMTALSQPASQPPRQVVPQQPQGYGPYPPGYVPPAYYPQPYVQPGTGPYPRY